LAVNAGGINGENADLNADDAELWDDIGINEIFCDYGKCKLDKP
jgi:hypothetical protein